MVYVRSISTINSESIGWTRSYQLFAPLIIKPSDAHLELWGALQA